MRASQIPRAVGPELGIDGLVVRHELGRGAHSVVYLATFRGREVALKVCRADRLEADEGAAVRFRREGAALARLSHRGLARVLCVGADSGGRPYMMLERVSGEPLAARIARGVLSEAETVALALEVASALSEVHRRGLVHRDVKPANIMLREDGAPKLIDFGLALEHDAAPGSDAIVGTFAYSPPEQTRMIRRPVDARSDLYSLGIVMFECLTGAVPFYHEDIGRLIQMHAVEIAKGVRSLRPEVSAAVEAIVAKLLAKDPDDRYASAASLAVDLERIAELGPDPKQLGTHRARPEQVSEGGLVGRSYELSELARVAAEARAGKGSLVSVRGESGCGTTHLARAWLTRERSREGVVCLWAACGTDSGTPLGGLRSALSGYARGEQREVLGPLLRKVAGDYGPCLGAQFPALSPLLGERRLDAEVTISQDLGYEAVCVLLAGLARSVGLLLLVVDDAHLMDSATRGVLERLKPRLAELPIVVLCTSPVLAESLEGFVGSAKLSIELGPFDAPSVAALAGEFLGSQSLEPSLTQQLHARSGGSPTAVLELLRVLLDRGLLTTSWGHWALDATRLGDVPLPQSAEKLAVDRLRTLRAEEQAVLRVAAVAGRGFDPEIVAAVGGFTVDATRGALEEAVAAHLIEHLNPGDSAPRYAFLHQQARVSLLSELEPCTLRELHKGMALHWEQRAEVPERVFEVAQHWAEGVDAACAVHALAAVTQAAEGALSGLAFSEAERWFRTALDLATAHGLSCDYRVFRGLAEACAYTGQMAEATRYFTEAVEICQVPADRANLHLRLAELCLFGGFDTVGMRAHLVGGWEALGQSMPGGGLGSLLLQGLWYLLCAWLGAVSGWGFGSKAKDATFRAQYKLIEQTGSYAFMTGQLPLLLTLVPRNAYVSHRVGRSRELIWARAARAHTFSTFGVSRKKVDAIMQTAYDLADELGDVVARARAAQLHASALYFVGDVADADRASIEVLQRHGRILDVAELCMCTMELCGGLAMRGHTARAKEHLNYCSRLLRERSVQGDTRSESLLLLKASLDVVEGRFAPTDALGKSSNIVLTSPKDAPFRWHMVHHSRFGVYTEADDYGPSLDPALDLVAQAGITPHMSSWHFISYWYLRCISRSRQYSDGPKAEAPKRRIQFEAELKALSISVRRPCDRWMLQHMRAVQQAMAGNHNRALELLSQAESSAQIEDCPRGVFATRLDRAVVLRQLGHVEAATTDIGWALDLADRAGWVSLARGTRRRFHVAAPTDTVHTNLGSRQSVNMTLTTAHTAMAQHSSRERDALLEVSLAAAELTDPHARAQAVLEKLLQLLGGERAFVFLWDAQAGELAFYAARDAHGTALDADAPHARSLVSRVASTRTALVLSGTNAGAELGSESVVTHDLRSMICAPLSLRKELLGVVYLDSRLSSGVFTEKDLSILIGLANHIAIAHAGALAAQRELERRAAERDLELSAAVQALLLPAEADASWEGLSLAAHFRPAAGVAGDWWFYDRLADGTLRVVIGDVTGHGAAAAMVSAVVAGWYRRMRADGIHDTSEILLRLHEGMKDLCGGKYLMPLAALELSVTGSLRSWSAAAQPVLIRRASGRVEVLQVPGAPLGGERFLVPTIEAQLEPGDRALLASDGLFEMPVVPHGALGMRRVRALLGECGNESLAQARDQFVAAVEALSTPDREDDLTFVLVGR